MSAALLHDPSTVHDGVGSHLHGAHTRCQREAAFVTLVCGLIAGWDERDNASALPPCPLCWNAEHCPVCGAILDPARK